MKLVVAECRAVRSNGRGLRYSLMNVIDRAQIVDGIEITIDEWQ
jgi:hypothetical protein